MRSPISFLTLAALCFTLYFLSEVEAGPTRGPYGNRINRRGFKSSLLSTARGFGKRSDES